MTMSIKIRKPSLVIKISIFRQVWQRKRWETSLRTCVPLSKTIVATISRSVLWATVCLFLHGHRNKWVFRSLMVWPHWHHERWVTVKQGKLRWVHSALKKWVDDRWNVSVVKQANNQMLTLIPTHEWRCARTISKWMFTKSETNSCSCKWFAKEAFNWG
jgi:hypothetical protein